MRVALTGGIGSGKSVVAAMLAERGAVVIDSDVLAREVVEPGTPGLAAIVEAFGPAMVGADGRLDRPAMAAMVFADGGARERLNAIVHPLVRERARALERQAPPGAVVVHDIPLLVEAGLVDGFDAVVVVDAPESAQLDRLTRIRGMDRADAAQRMAAQATRDERRAVADWVIVNDGSLDDVRAHVDAVWRQLTAAAAEG